MNKFAYLSLLTILLLLVSCKEDSVNDPEDTRHTFEIDLADYSTNHFFLDTIYASVLPEYNLYNRYHQSIPPWVNLHFRVKNLEIWKQSIGVIDTSKEIRANAFLNLPELRKGEKYDSTFFDITQWDVYGENMINTKFIPLLEGADYTYNSYTGVVSFLEDVINYDAFASTYSIEGETPSDDDDIYFGNSESGETAILKLFKPQYLQPNSKQAWKLQLRNIYPIGAENILEDGFELEIGIKINGEYQNYIEKWEKPVQLITKFEFDQIDENGDSYPDGKFDFRKELTISPISGEIIFPSLEPFGRDLPESIPDSFKIFSLYDTIKTFVDKSNISIKVTGKYNN